MFQSASRLAPAKTLVPHLLRGVATLVVSLAATSSSFAATGIFGSYLQLKVNTASAAWYGAQEWGTNIQDFNSANLGTVNWVTGTLNITAWQVQTYKNSGGDVFGANMFYRVYQQGSTPPSFTQSTGNFIANAPFTGPQGTSTSSGGDQNWGRDPISINLLMAPVYLALLFTAIGPATAPHTCVPAASRMISKIENGRRSSGSSPAAVFTMTNCPGAASRARSGAPKTTTL
mgnify:CR=1 FL=1